MLHTAKGFDGAFSAPHAAAALAENDLEDTLLEFAYSSSTGPSLGNGAWVSFTRVRLGD